MNTKGSLFLYSLRHFLLPSFLIFNFSFLILHFPVFHFNIQHWTFNIQYSYFPSFTNRRSRSSKETPFVSGTFVSTQINCSNIINAKKAKMGQGLSLKMPLSLSRNAGVINVINAANTQCTLAPNDCPMARTLFGNISEINTQITAPCPTAWDAMNTNRKRSRKPAL